MDQREGTVLADVQPREPVAVEAAREEPQVGLPRGDRPCSAADRLEVVVRKLPDRLHRAQNGGPHAVATRHVLRPALGREPGELRDDAGERDGVGVVAVSAGSQNLDARADRSNGPEGVEVALRDHYDQRHPVVRTHSRERPRGVSGGSDHEGRGIAGRNPGADRVGFALLEGPGQHARSALGPVAGEGDVQALQSEVIGESGTPPRYRRPGAFERAVHGKPLPKAVDALLVRAGAEYRRAVLGPQERLRVRGRVVKRSVVVVDAGAGGETAEGVVQWRGLCLFHVSTR